MEKVFIVFKDGSYKSVDKASAKSFEASPNWLVTLPGKLIKSCKQKRPQLLHSPDTEILKQQVTGYLDFVESEDYHEDNDYRQYIFEAAVEAYYGKDVWSFINSIKQ